MDRAAVTDGRRPARIRRWTVAGAACAVALGALVTTATTPATAAPAPKPVYYLALGDSLAAGTGASTTATRYVNVLYQHELATFPTLQLDNIACGGATTTSMIDGPGCSYTTGTQLGDAEAFLRAHPRQVAFVTIDIGANNVDGCQSGSTISPTCLQNGLTAIATDLPQILSGLQAAAPGVAVYGMNYYDPFLGEWLLGSSGQSLATQSVALLAQLNGELAQIYAAAGGSTADVATPFQSTDFDPTGSYLGTTEPQNVADICNWTHFCSGSGNIHANDIGHGLVAAAFGQVVDGVAVTTTTLPTATVGQVYGGQLTANGGHPRYHWSLAPGSGPLPPGLRLTAAGALKGRATAAGTYPVTVQVTDSKLPIPHPPAVHSASATLSVVVQA